ncbi:MAG TPA: hypothetical protein VF630_01425, partial [Hymenobacter sp.]
MADFTPPNAPALTEQPEAKSGPSNLRLRVIYAFIGAAMLLGSVWYSAWTFALFFAAVQVKMLLEFYRMMRAGGYAPAKWIGVGAGLLLFSSAAYPFLSGPLVTTYGNLSKLITPPALGPAWMQVTWAWAFLFMLLP